MKTFALPYGKTELTITLPEEHVLYDIHGNGGATIQDVQAATREALLHPLDSAPLSQLPPTVSTAVGQSASATSVRTLC